MFKTLLTVLLALTLFGTPAMAGLNEDLELVQQDFARIKYQIANKDAKLKELAKLSDRAAALATANPKSADAKIWQGVTLATEANITKELSSLPKVERAKLLLEESIRLNPRAMEGAAHMALGSMYFQVPGWPISFGNDKKAESHLKQALAIAPANIDNNYWYGEYLLDQGRHAEAIPYLEKAAAAPARKGREAADGGRMMEARAALAKARQKNIAKSRGNE